MRECAVKISVVLCMPPLQLEDRNCISKRYKNFVLLQQHMAKRVLLNQ